MTSNPEAFLAAIAAGAGVGLVTWSLFNSKSRLASYGEIFDAEVGAEAKPLHVAEKPSWTARLETTLRRAGWEITVPELEVLWGGISVVVAILFAVLSRRVIAGVILGPLAATIGIYLIVQITRVRRLKLIDEQLVRALFSLAGMLQAGRTPTGALEEVAKTLGPPLGSELSWIARQPALGVDLGTAMSAVADRLGSKEFEYFTIAVQINEEKGGDLVNVLGKLAAAVSTRIALRGQTSALLAEVQMTRHIASVSPGAMALLLWVTSPATMQAAFKSSTGVALLGLAVILWAVGTVVLTRMVKPLKDLL